MKSAKTIAAVCLCALLMLVLLAGCGGGTMGVAVDDPQALFSELTSRYMMEKDIDNLLDESLHVEDVLLVLAECGPGQGETKYHFLENTDEHYKENYSSLHTLDENESFICFIKYSGPTHYEEGEGVLVAALDEKTKKYRVVFLAYAPY